MLKICCCFVGGGFVLDIALYAVSTENIWIFASLDDCSVRLFTIYQDKFNESHVLKGHEDWTQTLDPTIDINTGDILLASGNQDSFIRVWGFQSVSPTEALSEQSRKIEDLAPNEEIETKRVIFSVNAASPEHSYYSVSVETILSGHDDKVFAVQWCQSSNIEDLR